MRFTPIAIAVALTFLRSQAQHSPAKPVAYNIVPLSTFTDATKTLTFQYPKVWKRVGRLDDYSKASAFGRNFKPEAVFEFTGDGNLYSKTVLSALAFEYGSFRTSAAAGCKKVANGASNGENKPSDRRVNGTRFRYSKGGDSSAGHGIDTDVYTAFRNGICYVFEEDFATTEGDGVRDLTEAELQALQSHLDAIMMSVKFLR